MRFRLGLCLFAIVIGSAFAQIPATQNKVTTTNIVATANAVDIRVYVNGMVCSFCAQGLSISFEKHPSVDQLIVSLETHSLGIILKPGRRLSNRRIRNMITDSGYTVESITRN